VYTSSTWVYICITLKGLEENRKCILNLYLMLSAVSGIRKSFIHIWQWLCLLIAAMKLLFIGGEKKSFIVFGSVF
jgi:hypothetical protein